MPMHPKCGKTIGVARHGMAVALFLLLSGCFGGVEVPSMLRFGGGSPPDAPAAGGALGPQQDVNSPLIADLQARRSIVPPTGSYAEVVDAVLAASSGAAAAELRVARLRAEARSKNWLPQIGPNINLTSLGGLVASLLIEQAVFDNGRRKAEREFAAADVELAAVGLSAEINSRVYAGLSHYIKAERARARSAVARNASDRLAEFEKVMGMRVEGGISDRSEQRVIAQRFAEMRATLEADHQDEATALAALAVLAGRPMHFVRGLDALWTNEKAYDPLSVMQARGEAARAVAEARIQRAGLLPGLTASAGSGSDGVDTGLRLGGGRLGFGVGADMRALAATAEMMDRRTAEAAETANSHSVALQHQIATLQSSAVEGAEVLRQTTGNLEMFTEQYKVGRRTLLELVALYDSHARLEHDLVSLEFDIALLQLELARDIGGLVDGARL